MEQKIKDAETHQNDQISLTEKLTEDQRKISLQLVQIEMTIEDTRNEFNKSLNKMATAGALADTKDLIMESVEKKVIQLQIDSKIPESMLHQLVSKSEETTQKALESFDKRLGRIETDITLKKASLKDQLIELQEVTKLSTTVDVLMNRLEMSDKKSTNALTEFSM